MAGRPIDEKIVAMKMDNSDFKRKAVETTGLFGKLQSALSKIPNLNLGKTTQAFGDIQRAANNTDLSGLSRAADTVSNRFSNMGIVATTAIMNLTNRAIDAGIQLGKSLTVAPVMDGFNEYELKMNSIQTMLSNTEWEHTTLSDVKATLAELNTYADKTIYDFGQMTSSIGKWTAAGVGLEDSAIAIKGMGNLAAVSGASVDQLNTAMYQMSQGMAAGKFGAIDWISMTNAGMGGKKTQDALMATARGMGKNIDLAKGFKGSLEQGWLTADVFLKTMQQFGKDKSMTEAATSVRTFTGMIAALKEGVGSGWAETWELVFGDFEVATKRWTALSKAIGGFFDRSTKGRNKFVKSLADNGVFQTLFDGVTNSLNTVLLVFDAIGKGFHNAFPPVGLETVKSFAKGFRSFFGALTPSRETFQNIVSISTAFFGVLKAGGAVIAWFAKSLIAMIPPDLGSNILALLGYIGKMVISFSKMVMEFMRSDETVTKFKTIISAVSSVLQTSINIAKQLGKSLIDMIPPGIGDALIGAGDKVLTFLAYLASLVLSFTKAIDSGNNLNASMGGLSGIFSNMGAGLSELVKMFTNFGDAMSEVWSILSSGKFTGKGPWDKDSQIVSWLFGMRDAFKSVGDYLSSLNFSLAPVAEAFNRFFKAIGDGYNWVKEKLSGIGDAISKALPDGHKLFAGGFIAAMITIVGLVIKTWWDLKEVFMGWGKIGNGISEVLEGVGGALEGFSRQMTANAIVTTVMGVAIALGILAGALWIMSRIPSDKVAGVLTALVTALSGLIGGMAIMTKYDIKGTGMKAALTLVAMGIAMAIIAGALKKLGDLKLSEIGKGILGLVGIMAALSGALILMSRFGGAKMAGSALQILAIAASIHILVAAVKKIADIDPEVLKKGMKWLGVILLELGVFFALAGRTKFGIGATLGMLAVGKAVINIVDAIKEINKIDPKDLKTGLKTIAQILGAIVIFAAITGYTGLFAAGAGMLLVAAAITALMIPLAILGHMDIEVLTKGLGAMSIALFAIAGASALMKGSALSGVGLILIAVGLTALMVPLAAFGAMSWGTIFKAMTGLALSLLIIGGATALLAPVIPLMVTFGLGVLALGAGMALAGIGMTLFATGLVTLATMTAASITAIVATIGTLIAGLASLIPMAVDFVIKLAMQIITAVGQKIPEIVAVFGKMLVDILNTIAKYIPQIVDAAVKIITSFLDALTEHLPKIVDSAAKLMVAFVDSLASAVETNGPKFLDAIMRLMSQVAIIMVQAGTMVIDALFGWIPGVHEATTKIGNKAEQSIRDAFGAASAGKEKGKEFADGLGGKSGDANSAGSKVGKAGKDGANSANLKTVGTTKGEDFVSALARKAGSAKTSGTELAKAGKTGAGSIDMSSTGSHFGSGFASGIDSESVMGKIAAAAGRIARKAKETVESWLDINSPSRVMRTTGGWFGEGFALGISDKTKQVGNHAKDLAVTAKDSLNQFLDGFELPEADRELRFKAVVDYDRLDTSKFGNPSLSVMPNTSSTSGMIPSIVTKANTPDVYSQNGNNLEMIRKQEQQLGMLQKQIELLSGILNKDNSTYLDGKEMYNSVKKVQDHQTNIRNIFKGVSRA